MDSEGLQEELLNTWILLNGKLKNSQMTKNLTYNEAIVMKIVYDQYRADGVGRTGVQHLVRSTNILKSQMNRIVNTLCERGYLRKEREGRNLYVYPVAQQLSAFLDVHLHSLELVRQVINAVGDEDAENLIRICRKIAEVKLDI